MRITNLPGVQIHPTALVNTRAIGQGTRIWAFCNILEGAHLGHDCQICDRVFIEGGARLGDRVTVKCGVSIWDGIAIESDVFVGPGVLFTNDPAPRSGRHLEAYPSTVIGHHASLGAGAIILPGVRVGPFALAGAGAVVTADVPAHALVTGNPARQVGWVCICAARLVEREARWHCPACARVFGLEDGALALERGDSTPW